MAERPVVPDEIVVKLRAVCLALPEVVEEAAWIGTRWTVRTKNFAHVLIVDGGRPASYAQALGTDDPACVLTFRSCGPELDVLSHAPWPYFKPRWFSDIVGLVIDDGTDWDEVAELLTESYCALAPQKLVELVDRPDE